ncbi:Retron-type reverse transcriptase [Saccharopolyspora endophytica]|uniref:Retron-type reverse transcriptase n=2 Tax=Saccharopolyspora endophytica TaxID=543886 RepID=A0ABS5DKA4_9PSEU|nr:Retron-type reverse transcriptase [Saccharopolyspora endophytica]
MPLLGEKHLRRALRQCGRRSSSAGADGMTWADLRRQAGEVLPGLAAQLVAGTWRPGPLRELVIPTYTGKSMPTAIPTVVDRLVHRAARNAVEPVLEARAFADWVSGYRPRRNRNTALRQASELLSGGYRCVADLDAAKVSEGVAVDEAVGWFAEYVYDGTFLRLLRTMLGGLPSPVVPGSGLAPLLINLRLSQVDRRLTGLRVVRFADNYCAFTETVSDAEETAWYISDAMAAVRLEPNAAKSRIRRKANAEDLFLIDG